MAQVIEKFSSGKEPVRIVCFGDSITGIYYHTGGRRAWPDMLGIALQRIYPHEKVEIINAGISGNTTGTGLTRMEKDVLAYKPHLVIVMYGMNDCAGAQPEIFSDNLKHIVQRSRDAGAEAVLCTPNSIYPQDEVRFQHLAEFAEVVRKVAAEMSVPLADCYRAYEDVRARNPIEWMLLMSETIHPAMNGHKLFAEVIAETITSRRISLSDVPPPSPSLNFTFSRLAQKQPVSVIAMPPYDKVMTDALHKLFPDALIDVTPWPVAGVSLQDIENWAKSVRAQKPTLVVIAVPPEVTAANEEEFIRSYHWVLNWSLAYGKQEWDVIAIVPTVSQPLNDIKSFSFLRELSRRVILGVDIGFVERPQGDMSGPEAVVSRWVQQDYAVWTKPATNNRS